MLEDLIIYYELFKYSMFLLSILILLFNVGSCIENNDDILNKDTILLSMIVITMFILK